MCLRAWGDEMTVVRWKFYDPNTLEQYTVPINPDSVTDPSRKKNIVEQPTVAQGGAMLLMEGRQAASVMEFSGAILTQAHHDAFNAWFDKDYPVKITDDLGVEQWVFITEYTPKRQRNASNFYKRTFTMKAYALPNNPLA